MNDELEQLRTYARQASEALGRMATGGRYELPTIEVAGEHYADPLFCAARVETRIRNAGRRYSPIGRRS